MCVPSFFVVLRAFLPAFQASLIYQYRCGQIRSHWFSSRYEFNSAGLRARFAPNPAVMPSESLLAEPVLLDLSFLPAGLTSSLLEALFSQCNAYVLGDVLVCTPVSPFLPRLHVPGGLVPRPPPPRARLALPRAETPGHSRGTARSADAGGVRAAGAEAARRL